MEIRYSTDAEAFYVTLGDGDVPRTVHISDDLMVDVEADGTLHSIELLCPPAALSDAERAVLIDRFPSDAEALAAVDRLTHLST